MDGTTAGGAQGATAMMAGLTTSSLVLVAVLAMLAVIAILYGLKRRHDRRAAQDARYIPPETVAPTMTRAAAPPPRAVAPEIAAPPVPMPPPPLADDPVVAAAPLDASPAAVAADGPRGDDPGAAAPTMLKGLGPKLAATLAGLGITRIDQIAALSPEAADSLDAQLGNFRGRIHRDRWIEQARLLSAGDRAGFEREFGKL